MRTRQRTDEQPPNANNPATPEGGGEREELAREGAALAAAGQDIITAALSGNSEAFLAASRQSGGQ